MQLKVILSGLHVWFKVLAVSSLNYFINISSYIELINHNYLYPVYTNICANILFTL